MNYYYNFTFENYITLLFIRLLILTNNLFCLRLFDDWSPSFQMVPLQIYFSKRMGEREGHLEIS